MPVRLSMPLKSRMMLEVWYVKTALKSKNRRLMIVNSVNKACKRKAKSPLNLSLREIMTMKHGSVAVDTNIIIVIRMCAINAKNPELSKN